MFSGFQPYDDEGYFLLSFKDYLAGQPLFTQALSVYGPFFYEVMGGVLKALGLAPNLENGRFVTLAVWLIASLLGGLVAYRLTRNVLLAVGAQFLTFRALSALVTEPMQPAGLISLLMLCLMLAATYRSARPRATAAVMGAIVGALLLIKINVGLLAALAVVYAWAGSLSSRWWRAALPLVAIVTTALPLLFMASQFSHSWVLELAVVVFLSAAALGVASIWGGPEPLPPPSTTWLILGGIAVVTATLAILVAGGTHLEVWWNNSIVLATEFPRIFLLPVVVSAGNDLWAALSLAAAIATLVVYGRGGAPASAALVRVWVGFFMWLSIIVLPGFLLALPLVWIATQTPRNDADNPTSAYCRLLLPALAVTETLQAYPIAGTQLSLAALGLMPIGAICLNDGIRQFRQAGSRAVKWLAPAALVLNVVAFLLFGFVSAAGFWIGTPLGLPGAESIRVPQQQSKQLQAVVAAIDRDCSSFITYPGMSSFYFWTENEPPAEVTSEVWWLVLDSPSQQAIVQQLQSRPRLCVVKNQKVIDFWLEGRQVPQRPLIDFIDRNFVSVGAYGDYELLIQ